MFLNGASVGFDTVNNKAVFIDQTLLPTEYKEISTNDYDEIYDAIKFHNKYLMLLMMSGFRHR